MWILAAVFSAIFAGASTVLSKCGIKNVNSNVATAIRTSVVLFFAWAIVFVTGVYKSLPEIDFKSWAFLILSGTATGASWICYFKALSLGEVSKAAAVDKSSAVLSVLFAIVLFPDERELWYVKIICLIPVTVGTYLMTDIKKGEGKEKRAWLLPAILSAIFAAATSLLAKVGVREVNSNLATAIRTCVVFVAAWSIVAFTGETKQVKKVTKKDLLFLVLSGVATGASWLCYYYAIKYGQVSLVVPIDKANILIVVFFSLAVFKEKLSLKAWAGLALLTVGTVLLAVLT